jgi:hypothetical protein
MLTLFQKIKNIFLTFSIYTFCVAFCNHLTNQFTIKSEIHIINSRHFSYFHQPKSNLSKYQKGLQHFQSTSAAQHFIISVNGYNKVLYLTAIYSYI